MLLAPVCVSFALLSIRNWRFLLVWLGLAAVAVVVVGHISWGSRPGASGKTLKVLTYNVAAFEIDKPGVLKVLKESDADIICLQEAGKIGHIEASAKALSKVMRGYYWTVASTNLILSRYPLSDQDSLNVPTKWPTKEFPSAVVETPLGRIRVMCVHLEPSWVAAWPPAVSGYVATIGKVCEDRRAQVDLILASLRPSKEPVILAGDFNGPAGSESVNRIGEYFTDCFGTTERGFGNTILAKMPYKRIDYVWVRGLVPVRSEVVDSVASDHRPVLTVVGL
jgi:endonuclease/exonuclease/phosphatase family metal-dependent hydrolase